MAPYPSRTCRHHRLDRLKVLLYLLMAHGLSNGYVYDILSEETLTDLSPAVNFVRLHSKIDENDL